MIISKKSPANNSAPWSKGDRKTLKSLVKEGKSTKEIADTLGRTPAAILYQKSEMGLTVSKVKGKVKVKAETPKIKLKNKEGKKIEVAPIDPEPTMRDNAKAMASAARQIARANGKRITMAMFFVEDL